MTIIRLPHTARRNQIAQVMNNLAIAGFGISPTLNLDFTDASMDLAGRGITFTRASSATRVNASGLIELVGNDVARRDYDPVGLYNRGLLIEESRTNSLRNSEAGGASAGTPGTLPTNWAESALAAGLTRQIVSVGSSNGLNYVDFRIFGTTGDATGWQIEFEQNIFVNAVSGENWANSFYCYLLSGTVAGVNSFNCRLIEGNPGYLADSFTGFTPGSTTSLIQARRTHQRTLNNASTTKIRTALFVPITSGQTIDFTLRVAAPQLEGNAATFSTSYIPTTSAAVTRAADVASMTGTNFSSWFNATEGTFVISGDTANVTAARIFVSANDASENNLISLGIDASANPTVTVINGGVSQASIDAGTALANTVGKFATAYKLNDIAASWNGGVVGTDASATLPTVNQLTIGKNSTTTAPLNGHLQRLTYYNKRLPDATLQALST